MENTMKIVSISWRISSLIKGVSETIESEAIEQKVRFLGMSWGILGASLLGN